MFDTLMKLDDNRENLDFYATDKRAIEEQSMGLRADKDILVRCLKNMDIK